jgi:hypothetical protein
MRKLLLLLSIIAIVLSCSSDETSTPVTPPPAPIAKYTITLSAGEGGTVSTTGGEYEAGQTVSVTATPQGEYVFTSWSDGNTNATRTITVSSNSTLTANFEKRKYPLTINFEGEGEVIEEIVNTGRTTEYDSGTTVKLTAQAAAEWVFVGWTGDVESTEESVQIVIGEPKEVTATFEKKKYPLTVNIEGEGEVLEEIVNTGRTTDYDSGTTVKLTAVPADGWEFSGWTGGIESKELVIEIEITEAKTLEAKFMRYFNYNKTSYELDDPGFWVDYFEILGYPENRDITVDLFTGSYPLYRIAVGMPEVFADFNFDGYIDIMFAPSVMTQPPGGYGEEPLWFYKNSGDNINFELSNELLIKNHIGTYSASAGLLGDFNGDGKPDIVYSEGGSDVHLGIGDRPSMLLSNNDGYEMKDISENSMMYGQAASGDIDNDGDLDVIMGGLGALTVFLNDGQANFTEYFQYVDDSYGYNSDNSIIELLEPVTSGGGMLNIDLYDVNKDGFLDLIGGWEAANRQLAIYYGNGQNFTKDRMSLLPYTGGWENLMNVNFYDVDDDGNIEIIVGRSDLYVTNGWYMELLKLDTNGEYYIVENGFDNSSSNEIEFFLNTNVRDIDGNGYIDVFCRDKGQGGNGEFRFEWNGSKFEKRF